MDQRIFEQLDKLERGARVERPPADTYNNSSAEFSAYDGPQLHRHGGVTYQREEDEYPDEPMTLDSFDEQLLRQPDQTSRHGQAALGRARLSLPPAAHQQPDEIDYGPTLPQLHRDRPTHSFDLSRFALDQGNRGISSSSEFDQPLPSSPAFKVSQRRPAPVDYGRQTRPSMHYNGYARDFQQHPEYEPLSSDQLEAEEHLAPSRIEPEHYFRPSYDAPRPVSGSRQDKPAAPVVQGISLVSTHTLPDRLRAIFPYPLFNAVQSKTFDTIYKTNNNFVLSAPTGSGKTAVLELAICRLISSYASDSYKIVYQAPTKSLCSERQRDWQAKFAPLGLQCAELTGDTDNAHVRNVQQASIIITTPEKWDSMTRKWKDHQRLMQMVKLFLIDEVHILKEDRGATLEAVVSRMKSVGSDVRFVALSATVPNAEDIATWLGKDPVHPHIPASRDRFGEEFRPVRLQKHVCGYQASPNEFAFEKTLNSKLPEVIFKWSQRKPIMVFCFTRNACVDTAKVLSNWWATKGPRERFWSAPRRRLVVADKELRGMPSLTGIFAWSC
ncbi:ATP-dependent DNA helicase MER3 [Vermiconidia calcicola]|uniref:ATP-dependent DNA helicase MER3 n=1 Tax=Vermiconidia calcicola TaxID=1690605 RepID=A0ACC3N147_9PEZI|nr:ATP-dependent DNA helicase MER3 [Vermiconidia calcicola]